MQSFDLYPNVSIYISRYRSYLRSLCSPELFFQANYRAKGYILSINISLHIYRNLCPSSVTDIQYEWSLLSYLDTFSLLKLCVYSFGNVLNYLCCIRSFSQETRSPSLSHWSYPHFFPNGITRPFWISFLPSSLLLDLSYHCVFYLSRHFSIF